jgi:hypothetical protein
VPGVWTYNYYDGWVPNYMFWIGVSHNAIGRFYETQSGGANVSTPGGQSREWYRPNPNPGDVRWNSRSNVNMQQSALLVTLTNVQEQRDVPRELLREDEEPDQSGQDDRAYAYVIPADQRKKIRHRRSGQHRRREGVDISVASSAFKAGSVDVKAGDYVVRMDQPYRGIVEMYLGVQWYPPNNPRPYDDTGWSDSAVAQHQGQRVDDKSILDDSAMTVMGANAAYAGGIQGDGQYGHHRPHDRQQARDLPMGQREREDVGRRTGLRHGRPPLCAWRICHYRMPIARRWNRRFATWVCRRGRPTRRRTCPCTTSKCRVSATSTAGRSTQDEGWVRMGLDMYKIPYK